MGCIENIYHYDGPSLLGKTPDQKKVIKFFFPPKGCLGLFMGGYKPAQYAERVKEEAAKVSRADALSKLGIDEDEIKEIPEFAAEGYVSHGAGSDGVYSRGGYTSDYEVSYFFFSQTQMFISIFHIDMAKSETSSRTEEIFYKDIQKISVEKEGGYMHLNLSFFGEKVGFAVSNSSSLEQTVNAVKQKIREARQ